MQEEIDEFFKKIFSTIECFQKKRPFRQKKDFFDEKKTYFWQYLAKSLLTDQVIEKKTDL